jgi:predicted CXXCH cytochrome family protein
MRKLALLAFFLVPAAASAQSTGIRNSAHDLSSSSGSTTGIKSSQDQICVFCHTPHKAQSTQLLWNHSATANATASWGNDLDGVNALTKTTAGTSLPTSIRSASKRCLGCHDGSVAIGDVSNAGGGSAGTGLSLAAVTGKVDANGKLIDGTHVIGAGGNMGGNHPISIPYAGQTGYNGANSQAIADGAIGNYFLVTTAGCTSPSGICTTAPASDGRNGAAINLIPNVPNGTTNAGVECTSCHEPHNKFGNPYFTRVAVTTASGLCRSCHNK